MSGSWGRAALGVVLVLATGCLGVAEERAQRDAKVGQRTSEGMSVAVEGGLAAVRALSPRSLTLWAQAPELSLSLKVGPHGGAWQVRVRNALADAELRATISGAAVPTTRTTGAAATDHTWAFDAPADSTVTLRLVAPDGDASGPYHVAVFADVQERIDAVQELFAPMAKDPRIRFALISGDLTENGSREQLERFQTELGTLPFPCYATLGNHELGEGETTFHDFFGRGSYSFVFRSVRFTMLDDASATLAEQTWGWLDTWLAAGRDQLHVITMHIPARDPHGARNGAWASRAEALRFLTALADADVDATLYGHVHSFYAFSNAGIPAWISGGGGAIEERLDGIGRHFLVVRVDPDSQAFEPAVVRVD